MPFDQFAVRWRVLRQYDAALVRVGDRNADHAGHGQPEFLEAEARIAFDAALEVRGGQGFGLVDGDLNNPAFGERGSGGRVLPQDRAFGFGLITVVINPGFQAGRFQQLARLQHRFALEFWHGDHGWLEEFLGGPKAQVHRQTQQQQSGQHTPNGQAARWAGAGGGQGAAASASQRQTPTDGHGWARGRWCWCGRVFGGVPAKRPARAALAGAGQSGAVEPGDLFGAAFVEAQIRHHGTGFRAAIFAAFGGQDVGVLKGKTMLGEGVGERLELPVEGVILGVRGEAGQGFRGGAGLPDGVVRAGSGHHVQQQWRVHGPQGAAIPMKMRP